MLDIGRMKRVFHNISANAAEAMTDGGSFRVISVQVGDMVHVELHDTGPGIPEEIRDRLFDPFVTSGKTHGTGLGLAVVKRIVQEHNAEITVATSTTGTTFTIRLGTKTILRIGRSPIAASTVGSASAAASASSWGASRGNSMVPRVFPFTCTATVTISSTTRAVSASGHVASARSVS